MGSARHVQARGVRSSADLLRLILLLGAIGWAGSRAALLELDVENRSMHSADSAEARAEELRERCFGHAETLVVLLAPLSAHVAPPAVELDRWERELRGRPEVERGFSLGAQTPDERLLALNLKPDASGGVAGALAALAGAAQRSQPANTRVFVSGAPAGEAAIAAALDREQRRIVPAVGALLFLLLLLVYRSPALALGALLPAIGGIAMTGALQQACGLAINPVTSLLAPVLLAVGVAGCVHLIDAYLAARARGFDPQAASHAAMRSVRVPALGCAATTVIGFLALCLSPIPAIQRFGGLAAAGVGFTFLLSFSLLPVWLRLFARSSSLESRSAERGWWRRRVGGVVQSLQAHARAIAVAAAVAAVALGWAWTGLKVDTDPLRILPEQHAFRVATREIGARLGGTDTFDLLLQPPGPGGALALLALQTQLLGLDGIAGPAGVPRSASDGPALLSLLLEPGGTSSREICFARAEQLARDAGWHSALACGSAVRTARDSGAIARGEIYGLAATLLALGPCIWIGLRSLRLTLLGLAANALPCLLMHGGLALAGMPLSVGSAMIGSVILGIVVDDAIYFLHEFREQSRAAPAAEAIAASLGRSGRAMSVSSLVLALGFLVGVWGELSTTREFACLASAAILTAWAANLFLLPAFLLVREQATRARGGAA